MRTPIPRIRRIPMALRKIVTSEDPSLYKRRRRSRSSTTGSTSSWTTCAIRWSPRTGGTRRAAGRRAPPRGAGAGDERAGERAPYVIELVNPEIVERSGEQYGPEGCLSVPGRFGLVKADGGHRARAGQIRQELRGQGRGPNRPLPLPWIDHLEGVVFTSVAGADAHG